MIITKTPLRVSFTGGGTDIADFYANHGGGAVVSSCINKYIYITVNPKFDNKIRISYSKTEIVDTVDELNHEIARAALHMAGISGGIEITSIADIPAGTGLGSSSTFTVGLINALFTYAGRVLAPAEMAELACKIEIDILGHPIGKQDQYAAAFGGFNFMEFLKDDLVIVNPLKIKRWIVDELEASMLLYFTGVSRSSAAIIDEEQRNTSTGNRVAVEAMHRIKQSAIDMKYALFKGDMDAFARIIGEAWEDKKKMASSITNPMIQQAFDVAMTAGAKAGKVSGAGGGGFIMFMVDPVRKKELERALKNLGGFVMPFKFSESGAHAWKKYETDKV